MKVYKRRKKYSMDKFLELVSEEAGKIKEDYYSVGVDITHTGIRTRIEFNCYVNNCHRYSGDTVDECIDKLKKAVKPKKPKSKSLPEILV